MNIKKFIKDPYKLVDNVSDIMLEKYIIKLSDNYYNKNDKELYVDDNIFDFLVDKLESRNPDSKYFQTIGSSIHYDKVKLPFPMFSLNKVKPDKSIDNWLSKFEGDYIISDKLDGMSALYYNNRLYKRGEGIEGQEMSHLIPYINFGCDNKCIDNDIAIRGELIVSTKNFVKINKVRDFKNARVCVSGIVNTKNPDKNDVRLIDFVAYNILYPIMKQSDQLEILKKLKCNTVVYEKVSNINSSMLINMLDEHKKASIYDIDGLVITDNDRAYDIQINKKESDEQNPSYSVAFKYLRDDQIIQSIVTDVEWNISRLGYIKPKIRIEPIEILGTTITYATAHNARFIYKNKINVGTVVEIAKSGDVIPKIIKIVKSSKTPKMPDIEYVWNDTNIDICSVNHTTEQTIQQLVNTLKNLNVKYFSEGCVNKLYKEGITSLYEYITTDLNVYKKILGNVMGLKIYNNLISSLKNTTFLKLMHASNCFNKGIGIRKIELVINNIPELFTTEYSIKKLKKLINNINGFSDITSNTFIDGFNKFKIFLKMISNQDVINFSYLFDDIYKNTIDINSIESVSTFNKKKLINLKIVMTGFRDKNIEEFIISNGGIIMNTVSSNTTMLIIDNDNDKSKLTIKYKKAESLNIIIITKTNFVNKYMNNI